MHILLGKNPVVQTERITGKAKCIFFPHPFQIPNAFAFGIFSILCKAKP